MRPSLTINISASHLALWTRGPGQMVTDVKSLNKLPKLVSTTRSIILAFPFSKGSLASLRLNFTSFIKFIYLYVCSFH